MNFGIKKANNFNFFLVNLLVIFVFSIPIVSNLSVKILLVALALLFIFRFNQFSFSELFKKFWSIFLFVAIILLGLINSNNIQLGVKILETLFCLIGIPLLSIFNKDFFLGNKAIKIFSFGVLTASLICLFNGIVQYLSQCNPNVFYYYELTSFINSHPTYLAYYIIIAISWTLYDFSINEKSAFKLGLFIFSLIVLTITLTLTGGQTAFIGLLLVFSFFLLNYILSLQIRKSWVLITIIVVMISVIFSISMVIRNNRNFESDDSWERFQLWESGIKASQNFLFGVGTGDSKETFENYIISNGIAKKVRSYSNTHNQFIEIYLSNGVVGLLAILILIGRPLYLSYMTKSIFDILLLFPFVIYGVTEVFLGRYQGVVVFALVQTIVISHSYAFKQSIDGNSSNKLNITYKKF